MRTQRRSHRSRWLVPVAPGSRVTPLELFYDLIFVFAFLNVTGLVSANLTVRSVLSGVLVLALLWWCWSSFVALGNNVRVDHGILPPFGFVIMAAVFILALAMPQAFVDRPGNLNGPAVFAICYLIARGFTHAAIMVALAMTGRTIREIALLTVPLLVSAALIALAVAAPWWAPADMIPQTRLLLWALVLVADYSTGILLPRTSYPVTSAGHLAERHGLIVMIALGEAVIALGTGPGRFAELTLTGPVVTASVLGIALIVALYWLHFDTLSPFVEQRVHGVRDRARVPLVRDVFIYLHLFMIMGIVSTALGLKLVLGVVAAPGVDPLPWPAAAALYGGVALYLLAGVAATLRTFGRSRHPALRSTLAATVILVLLIPLTTLLTPLAALALLVAICTALALIQAFTATAVRALTKERVRQEEHVVEDAVSRWREENL